MMGGWGMMGGGWGMFGWIFGLLFSIGLLVLLALGIIWMVRQLSGTPGSQGQFQGIPPAGTTPVATGGRTCPTCGRPVAPDWTVCPYDGTPLSGSTPLGSGGGTPQA